MTHQPSKSHPVAVRIVHNAKKRPATIQPQPQLSPHPEETKRGVLAQEVMGKKKSAKEFVKPRETKKRISVVPILKASQEFFKKFRTITIVALGVLATLVFVMIFILPRVLYRSQIPGFLPENTIFFGAVSLDPFNLDLARLMSDLHTSKKELNLSLLDSISPIKGFSSLGEINFKDVVDREAAFAIFNGDDGLSRTLILHATDPKKAQKLLEDLSRDKNLEQKEYKGSNIFTIRDKSDATKSFSYMYAKKFIFISSSATTPFTIIDLMNKDESSLAKKNDYTKLVSKARLMSLGSMYVDTTKISQLSGVTPLLDSVISYIPLIQDESVYVSWYEKGGSLAFDMIFPREVSKKEQIQDAQLIPHLTSTTLFAFEGSNFSIDWDDLETHLKNSQPLLAFYFSNIKRRLVDSFGFDFNKDFASLFQDSYVVAIDGSTSRSKNTGKPFQNMALVLKLSNPKGFSETQSSLEDKVKKILSSQFQDQAISLTQEGYAGLTLNVLSGDGMPVNIYYVVKDEKLIISTNKPFFDNNVSLENPNSISQLSSYKKLSSLSRKDAEHIVLINEDVLSKDLFPKTFQALADEVLVRDTQKGDNAVVTGFIHLVAKQ